MHKIVVVGSSVLDTIVRSSFLKVVRSSQVESGVAMCEMLGGKLEAEEGVLVSGGGASNVSVALRRLGEAVKVVSRVGDDTAGKMVRDEMEKEGVDTSLLQTGEGKTGVSVVLVNGEGARSIVTYRGESAKLEHMEIDWGVLASADWLQISSLGGDMDLMEDLINFAFEKGVRVGINPGSMEIEKSGRLLHLLKKVEMLNLNRAEICKLLDVGGDGDIEELKRKILDLNIRVVVITDGKNGAGLVRNGTWMWMSTYANKSVDDTGAGDAFVSGVVSGLLSNRSDGEVLKMGLANGSSVVTKLGAKMGLLRKSEIGMWLKRKLKFTEEIIV